MRNIVSGYIEDNVPLFHAKVNKNKTLEFGSTGNILITADSGFTEGIALPQKILTRLKLEFIGYESFILADGNSLRVKTYFGVVRVGNNNIETFFNEGDHIMGMAFMSSVANELRVDFKTKKIILIK